MHLLGLHLLRMLSTNSLLGVGYGDELHLYVRFINYGAY